MSTIARFQRSVLSSSGNSVYICFNSFHSSLIKVDVEISTPQEKARIGPEKQCRHTICILHVSYSVSSAFQKFSEKIRRLELKLCYYFRKFQCSLHVEFIAVFPIGDLRTYQLWKLVAVPAYGRGDCDEIENQKYLRRSKSNAEN